MFPDLLENLEPRPIRQHQIEQDQVEGLGAQSREARAGVLGGVDLEALQLEDRLQTFTDRFFVVDDQDPAALSERRVRVSHGLETEA